MDVGDDFAVSHGDDTGGEGGDGGVVSNENDGLVVVLVVVLQEGDDFVGIFRVEIAGGLVGEEEGGAIDEGATNRGTLLFPAGELIRKIVLATFKLEDL